MAVNASWPCMSRKVIQRLVVDLHSAPMCASIRAGLTYSTTRRLADRVEQRSFLPKSTWPMIVTTSTARHKVLLAVLERLRLLVLVGGMPVVDLSRPTNGCSTAISCTTSSLTDWVTCTIFEEAHHRLDHLGGQEFKGGREILDGDRPTDPHDQPVARRRGVSFSEQTASAAGLARVPAASDTRRGLSSRRSASAAGAARRGRSGRYGTVQPVRSSRSGRWSDFGAREVQIGGPDGPARASR